MVKDALDLLPHRAPFRFVTEVLSVVPGQRGAGMWRVSGEEEFLRGHFPGDPIVPGVLLAEAMAQLAGLVAFSGCDRLPKRAARLAQVDLKFLSTIVPPAAIYLLASFTRALSGLYLFEVSASVEGTPAAVGTLVLADAYAHRLRGDSP